MLKLFVKLCLKSLTGLAFVLMIMKQINCQTYILFFLYQVAAKLRENVAFANSAEASVAEAVGQPLDGQVT